MSFSVIEEAIFDPKIQGEPSWVAEVKQILAAQSEDGLDRPPCIFHVTKALKSIKPEAYAPQLLSIGPFHRYRDDLYEMERFKILTAKKVQTELFKHRKFQDIIMNLASHEAKIRARYDRYLQMNSVELLWIMAIDGVFLLQFFHTFGGEDCKSVLNVSPRLSFMVDTKGHTKPSYDLIVKDVMMLENQFPIVVMKRILEVQYSNVEFGMNLLATIFLDMCKKISPFKIKVEHPVDGSALKKKCHLLGYLYSLINPKWDRDELVDHASAFDVDHEDGNGNKGVKQGCGFSFGTTNHRSPKKVFEDLWEVASQLTIVKEGPLKVVGAVKELATKVMPHVTNNENAEGGSSEGDTIIQVEEIAIPSVSDLVKAGIEFKATGGGLYSINFDTKTQTFELPVVNLDVNSEVILRNLVAYEAMAITGPQVLGRYTELMNGIVDTEEDVKILKEKGIITGGLKNKEVVELWNGMSKCIRLSKVEFMDEAIESVNHGFNSVRSVKLYRMFKAYVYGSWKMLVFLATVLVISLMCLQSFCTIYNCPRVFHFEGRTK